MSVKPRLFILRRHSHAFHGVRLLAGAILPVDVDLEVTERELRIDVERLVGETLLQPRVPDEDAGVEALRGVALLLVVVHLGLEEERVHHGAGMQDGPALPAGAVLHAKARAEDLETAHDADAEDRECDRDLEEREPSRAPACGHSDSSPTCTVPSSGSSATRSRFARRSRRLAMTTSAPLVLPFG